MVRSYDKIYLEQVSETIGTMFEYAIELGYNEVDFWNLFVYCLNLIPSVNIPFWK